MSEAAFVIHPVIKALHKIRDKGAAFRSDEDALEEIVSLVQAIDLICVDQRMVNVNKISPGFFLGKGTIEALAEDIEFHKPDVVIVNHPLSPVQQRNLEKALDCKVIDRTGLILEIFGERAQTKEGRIQVELAALDYQKSRLVRSWTHLERQRGGAGFMGGPGETQIELDRRIIADRITQLKKDLNKVKKTRELGRHARARVPFPIVALVGYTNAGKSTLFNTLTGSDVFAEDLLFATLDPTMRKLRLPRGQDIILADTVGFISDLPTALIAAFRSTLEQVIYADIILHVRDMAREDHEAQKQDVVDVLKDLDIEYETDERILEVWNKMDLLDDEMAEQFLSISQRKSNISLISARSGQGTETLLTSVEQHLARGAQTYTLHIPYASGDALSWLHTHGRIMEQENDLNFITVHVMLNTEQTSRFQARFPSITMTLRAAAA